MKRVRDYNFVCVEQRERIGPNSHFWTCAIKHRGQINFYHDTSPLAAMKLAVRACHDAIAREIAAELRTKQNSALEDWLR